MTEYTVTYGWSGEPTRSCVYRALEGELTLLCRACGVDLGERQEWLDPETGLVVGQAYCSACAVELGLSLGGNVDLCQRCGVPTHASESDDCGHCVDCAVAVHGSVVTP